MNTFEDFDLIQPLRQALTDLQFTKPTPIQAQTIPAALDGRDVLGCAQTGTGKTAAFALPILDHLGWQDQKPTARKPRALILAPTRELAIQIDESFAKFGKHLRVRRALVYGGVSQLKQVRAMQRGAHILVATPGRLIDLMGQGHVDLSELEIFVLDEVDRMLDMGFLPDLKRIIDKLPNKRQSLFYSATMPAKIKELASRLLSDPLRVNVTPKSPSVALIEQRVLFTPNAGKQRALQEIVISEETNRILVFTKTKRRANRVAEMLQRQGTKALAIHGNKSQNARQSALAAFQEGRVKVLVATDVAARGIDIDGISHVVNFDIPNDPESYVHRIGRTGRAGAAGKAISFCSEAEHSDLRAIERIVGKSFACPASARTKPTRQPTQSSSGKPRKRRFAGPSAKSPSPPRRKRRRMRSRAK